MALQVARAETSAAAMRVMDEQRAAEHAAALEHHREELNAAHSKNYLSTRL